MSLHFLLQRIARRRLWRNFCLVSVSHLLALVIGLCGLGLVDAFCPLTESALGRCFGGLALLALLSGLGWGIYLVRMRLTVSGVASRIEGLHPELKDSLHCALEAEASLEPNELERAVLARVTQLFGKDGGSYVEPLMKRRSTWLWPVGVLCSAALLVCFLGNARIGKKIVFGLGDVWSGKSSGLVILEPEAGASFLVQDDVRVRVKVIRWEEIPVLHGFDEQGDPMAFALHEVEGQPDEFAGTFYGVTDPLKFKVTTASLSTDWRVHRVYAKPELTAVRMTTVPLPYMGRKPQEFSQLQDIEVIDGEHLQLSVTCDGCTSLWLEGNGRKLPLMSEASGHGVSWAPRETVEWRLVGEDSCGKPYEFGVFTVTVLPDLPPELERQSPSEDTRVKVGDSIRLQLVARDDFGLGDLRLRFRIAGRKESIRSLKREKGEPRELSWNQLWDLPGLALQEGDVISCLLEAEDNRRPKAQLTRSEVFFISVVPDLKSDQDQSAEGESGDQPDQETKVDMSDLLHEAKRLLRLTWDLLGHETPPDSDVRGLVSALGDQHLEIGRRQEAIRKKAGGGPLPEPFKSLFQQASEQVEQALAAVRVGNLSGSLIPQENSLGALAKLENELIKNKAKMDQQKGKQGKADDDAQGKGKQGKEKEEKQGGDKAKKQAEDLHRAIESLQEAVEAQETINRQIGRVGDDALKDLAERQAGLRRQIRDVEQSLVDYETANSVRQGLREAVGEMSGVERALDQVNRQKARVHGNRALQRMLDGLAGLERLQREEGSRQMGQVSARMQALAERQRQAESVSHDLQRAKTAGKRDRERQQQARQEQERLRQETNDMIGQLDETAGALEKSAPDVAEELRKLSRRLASRNVQGHQKKASNGLLYRRYDRAAREQREAGRQLEELSSALRDAASRLPGFTEGELRQQLKRLQEDMSAVKRALESGDGEEGQQAMTDAAQRSARDLDSLSQMLKDDTLKGIREESEERPTESVSVHGGRLMGQLRRAVSAGLERLSRMERDHGMTLRREQSAPPEKYRRQVEEYFKLLGE